MSELAQRLTRIRGFLTQHDLDALQLQSAASFAWATCGAASYINTAQTNGLATLLITHDAHHVLTSNIEAPRIGDEEGLRADGWNLIEEPWYEAGTALADLTAGKRVGADSNVPNRVNLSAALARARTLLSPEEIERMRGLGKLCADAIGSAVQQVQPGMSEYEIAAVAAHETERRGAQAIVNLIATDERITRYRHPLPTAKTLQKYAMIVLCGRRHGLVCSITRLLHFGALPAELRRRADATAQVDATYLLRTRPGATLGAIFQAGVDAYAAAGYADEWKLHHQGGTAAFNGREYLGLPDSTDTVAVGQAYAWNPSIAGTKSEDTFIVGAEANELLTNIDGWPSIECTVDGATVSRPAILEVL